MAWSMWPEGQDPGHPAARRDQDVAPPHVAAPLADATIPPAFTNIEPTWDPRAGTLNTIAQKV